MVHNLPHKITQYVTYKSTNIGATKLTKEAYLRSYLTRRYHIF